MSLGDERAAAHPGKPFDSFEKEYIHHGLTMIWIPQKKSRTENPNRGKEIFLQRRRRKNRMELNLSGANAKPNPDAKAVRNTIAARERGRAFEAEKKEEEDDRHKLRRREGMPSQKKRKRPSKWKKANIW